MSWSILVLGVFLANTGLFQGSVLQQHTTKNNQGETQEEPKRDQRQLSQQHPISLQALNNHLRITSKSKLSLNKSNPTKVLEEHSTSSVIFKEIKSIVLTKSSYKILSYINFDSHLSTFKEISDLLTKTLNKTNSFMQTRCFPPYKRPLSSESQKIQNEKDKGIVAQLQELNYEINLVKSNFDLIKDRFFQITGQSTSNHNRLKDIDTETEETPCRFRRSVVGSLFRFFFSSGDDNNEAIKILKQNEKLLMANDKVQEQQLKEILKSQQINAGEIRINRDLLRQVMLNLTQVNVTLEEITFNTHVLFALANFQILINQL